MSVTENLLSPQACKPCISAVQDALLGSWLLTSSDTFLSEHDFMDTAMHIRYADTDIPTPAILKPCRLYTGKQLMSHMLPRKLIMGTPGLDDDGLCISNHGTLHRGRLHRKHIGTSQGGVVHTICVDLTPR